MILVPVNDISRMQVLLDVSHDCGWSVGAVGLVLYMYRPDSHNCEIPLAMSLLDMVFDSVNLFMLMPVVWKPSVVSKRKQTQ